MHTLLQRKVVPTERREILAMATVPSCVHRACFEFDHHRRWPKRVNHPLWLRVSNVAGYDS
jgi:hypothetical protein